jgi:phage terminase large subunit-like protein
MQIFPTKGDKSVRAQSIRGRLAVSGLHVPAGAPWLPDLMHDCLSFPLASMTISATRSDSLGNCLIA